MQRTIRYQAAIVQDDQLLIQQRHYADGRSYWLLPGGGIEADETAETCLQREVREETNVSVTVLRQLLDDPAPPGDTYQRLWTYLCHVVEGEPQPGYEPEPEAAAEYAIVAVGWFDLRDPASWDKAVRSNPITAPLLQRLRAALGYPPEHTTGQPSAK